MQHHVDAYCFMSCRAVSSLRRVIFVPGLWRRVMLIFDMFVYKFIQNMIIYIYTYNYYMYVYKYYF